MASFAGGAGVCCCFFLDNLSAYGTPTVAFFCHDSHRRGSVYGRKDGIGRVLRVKQAPLPMKVASRGFREEKYHCIVRSCTSEVLQL